MGKLSHPGYAFTTTYDSLSLVLQNDVLIERIQSGGLFSVSALWDTGATISLIRPEIAERLHLEPVSYIKISTPTDNEKPCNVYSVNLYLPNGIKVPDVNVAEGIPFDCDMLIGMDIIGLGDFAVSNYNGRTLFSFRMPSLTEIDFVKHSYLATDINGSKTG